MASTFSNLKFELIGSGEQSGTWGTTTNTNIGTAIEQAIVGMATLDSGDFAANVCTLTLSNTNAAQDARALCLNIAAGAVSAAGTINVPAIQKPYIVINGSSFTVTVKVSGLTGVAVPAGKRTVVYNNGTDVGSQIDWLAALDITTINATTVDATNLEVTNIKALDGTASVTLANSTGVASFTANPVLSGGTANGVTYLNGSKVLTSGSALTFDGTNFATTGTASATKLIPTGNVTAGNGMYLPTTNTLAWSTNGAEGMRLDASGNVGIGIQAFSTTRLLVKTAGTSNIGTINAASYGSNALVGITDGGAETLLGIAGSPVAFYTAATERMRIDSSGNVGIGTSSPGAGGGTTRLQVANANIATLGTQANMMVTTTDAQGANVGASIGLGGSVSTASPSANMRLFGAIEGAKDDSVDGNTNGYLSFLTMGAATITPTERMRIDSSGNLGLGVTPSASGSFMRVLQIGDSGSLSQNAGTMRYGNNFYIDSGGTPTYIRTSNASNYQQSAAGEHAWLNAPSGTAGNAITFTQAMTLDASGRLLVGVTSPISGNFNNFINSSSESTMIIAKTASNAAFAPLAIWNNAAAGDNKIAVFFVNASPAEIGSITYNRVGGLTVYGTTSDYRAKDIIGPMTDSGALIDSVPVYMGKMKGATQERPMFIAHEVPAYAHTGEKDAVDADGKPVYQQMDASALIPVMWAEIQSLRARVAALESN
jgi:hypothetical protein